MEGLIVGLRWIHIAAGTVALLAAPVAMLAAKGGLTHRRVGRLYFWSMAAVGLTAVALALYRPVPFFALIALFSFYNAFTGYRALFRKRPLAGQGANGWDWLAAGITVAASGALVGLGIARPGPMWQRLGLVAIVLGAAGVVLGARDLARFARPPRDPHRWWYDHMSGMLGSYIATVTAFSVVNFDALPLTVRWLWPLALGVPLIVAWIAYYKARFRRQSRAAA